MERFFAVSAPGLAPFTAQELTRLSLVPTKTNEDGPLEVAESGGVEFQGELQAAYRANLFLRTSSRVLMRFGEFHAAAFSELNRHIRRLPWERCLTPGQGVAVRVTCHQSRLYHQAAVAREVAAAIGDHLGKTAPLLKFDENAAEPPPQLVVVRLVSDQCTLSLDTSGALLHRRGYRLATAKAPLRETLAAGLLLASGWDPHAPLLDPFCGSGTIPIEAALLAANIPPGLNRCFAFMGWPGFRQADWEAIVAESRAAIHQDLPPILASDRDEGAIQIAQANAARAEVANQIAFRHCAVSSIEPTDTGWVVTNPPYGLRVRSNKDLRNLYAQFGKVLRLKCPGWQVAVLCSELPLLHQMGLRLDTSLSLVNGGVPVRLGRGAVPVETSAQ